MFNIKKIEQYVKEGKIVKSRHFTLPLNLYVYSKKTEVDNLWDEITEVCRGVVVSDDGEIVHNPMPKFFNIEQVQEFPEEEFVAFEKLDGSMINVSKYKNNLIVSTKGSFVSEQAETAKVLLNGKEELFDDDKTYVFEIIYPQNRIVVDYGKDEKMVLLSVRNKLDGKEHTLDQLKDWSDKNGFELAQPFDYDYKKLMDLKKQSLWNNKEGFVLLFNSGKRIKVKYDTYFILHKLRTELSEKGIIEALRDGNDLVDIYASNNIPDEFIDELKAKVEVTKAKFSQLHDHYTSVYLNITKRMDSSSTQKDYAALVLEAALESDDPYLQTALFNLRSANMEKFKNNIYKKMLDEEKIIRLNGECVL